MFEKSLTALIKGLRSHRGKDEAKFIAHMLDEIRVEVKSADMEVKAEAVLKLAYLRMLGYEVKSASFSILEAMASPQYPIKHVGYLAASLCFSEDTDVLILATNLIKKDLHSAAPLDVLAALNGLSHVINQELAQHLAADIAVMLTHSRASVRRRAVLVLYSAIVKSPDILDRTWDRLRDLLCDSDQGVVTATVNVVCELARRNPQPFVPLSPQLFDILTSSSNNWLLIKVLKLFGALARVEPRLVRKLHRPVSDLISTTPAMSVLYECIHTAIIGHMLDGPGGEELAVRCVQNLGQFLEDTDQNLKYIALLALAKLVPTHPALVVQHQATILASIRHADMTIRLRALDLVCRLAPHAPLEATIDPLVAFVEEMDAATVVRGASSALQVALDARQETEAEPASMPNTDMDDMTQFRHQVAESILELGSADEYALVSDGAWYLATLERLVGDVDSTLAAVVADQIMAILTRFASLRQAASVHYQGMLTQGAVFDVEQPLHPLLRTGAWVCGEYPEYVERPQDIARLLLQDRLRTLPSHTIAAVIQNTMKLYAYWTASLADSWDKETCEELDALTLYLVQQLRPLVRHYDSDVHERAQESLQLFSLLQKDLASCVFATGAAKEAPTVEATSWDESEERGTDAPRSLHLLQPLYFTREDDEPPIDPLPPNFDVHAWIVPESTWKAFVHLVEPSAKRSHRPHGRDKVKPVPTKSERKKSQHPTKVDTTPDMDVDAIPIVQLNLSDLAPVPATRETRQAEVPGHPDTPAVVPTIQPKMVTRKKKSRSATDRA